jgi:YD repeat-containing protein
LALNAGGNVFGENKNIDVVSFMEYDGFGRETKKYMPFSKANNYGLPLTGDLWNQQKAYYATQTEKAADQNYAFAETLLEESPLNRVLKQSSPGQDTQLATNHITRVVYGTNNNEIVVQPNGNKTLVAALLLNKIKQFDLVGHETQIENQKITYKLYAPNQLSAVVNINEDEQYSAQFTDKEGKVVTTRQYNRVETAANVFEDEVLETNYVYDLFGRLRFVIQPEASKVITGLAVNTEITLFTTTYKDFVFYYQYDKRGRMIRKRVPGMSAFVSMEYDERDLLIKSTDANGKITATEYDVLKRPVKNFLQNTAAETPLLLTESFYDTYSIILTDGQKAFVKTHAFGIDILDRSPLLLPTGTRTVVLNENNQARVINGQPQYLTSVIYYDYKLRPLQTVSENIFGKIERTSNKLDFSGRILESHASTEYLEAGLTKTLETYAKNTYDPTSRLAAVCQKLDNDRWEPISRNSYSPMGELSMKKLGCDQQRVDYAYNIKGWLTSINKPAADPLAFKASKDLFAMKLNYGGNFTGNITGQTWQTADRTDKNAVASTLWAATPTASAPVCISLTKPTSEPMTSMAIYWACTAA